MIVAFEKKQADDANHRSRSGLHQPLFTAAIIRDTTEYALQTPAADSNIPNDSSRWHANQLKGDCAVSWAMRNSSTLLRDIALHFIDRRDRLAPREFPKTIAVGADALRGNLQTL
jgi:hypothetical protein